MAMIVGILIGFFVGLACFLIIEEIAKTDSFPVALNKIKPKPATIMCNTPIHDREVLDSMSKVFRALELGHGIESRVKGIQKEWTEVKINQGYSVANIKQIEFRYKTADKAVFYVNEYPDGEVYFYANKTLADEAKSTGMIRTFKVMEVE